MPILTQRALVLAKVETTAGTDAVPTNTSNAVLVADPQFSVESDEIVREFARNDFSQYANMYGMKRGQISFSVEVRGGGVAAGAPDFGPLLEGCAMAKTTAAAGSSRTITAAPTGAVRASNVTTFTTSAAHGFVPGDLVTVASVTDSTFNGTYIVQTAATTTTFTVFNSGTNGNSGGGTAVEQASTIYTPTTTAAATITLYVYFDGILHKLTGAMGTWSLSAEAGGIAKIEFTFTGNYLVPTSTSMPVGTMNSTIPPLVENANLAWNGSSTGLFAQSWTIDMGNNIALRKDVNSSQGLHSVYISGRDPEGGFTPEVSSALNDSFWVDWAAATTRSFIAGIGAVAGNRVVFNGPAVQIKSIGYGDRDNIRSYDVGLAFNRASNTGDDELTLTFY